MRALKRRPVRLLSALVVLLIMHATRARAVMICSFPNVTGIAFGSYNPSSGDRDATGTISFLCVGLGASSITVDISKGSAPSFTPRKLYSGGSALSFNVFREAARTTIWGDGTSGTSHYGPSTPGLDILIDLTMYGRIPANQLVRAGLYSDTLVVTLNY